MDLKENIIVLLTSGVFAFAFYQYAKGYRPANGGDPTKAIKSGVAMGVRG